MAKDPPPTANSKVNSQGLQHRDDPLFWAVPSLPRRLAMAAMMK